MKPKNTMDVLLGTVFALGGAGIIAGAQQLTAIAGLPVGPGLFPTVTGAGMLIFGGILAVQGWIAPPGELVGVPEDAEPDGADPETPAAGSAPGWLDRWFIPLLLLATAAIIPLMGVLGFLLTGALYTAVVILLCGGSWLRALIFGPLLSVLIDALFSRGLHVPLPLGTLGLG